MQAAVVLVALLVAPAVIGLTVIPTIAQTGNPFLVINPTHAGIPEKFEEAFYEKILKTVSERSGPRSSGTTPQYYTVVVVVERYGPDGTDVSEMNKARIVEEMKEAGAKDIASAETLSFVIASVPVGRIMDLSTHEDVRLLGDGQLPLRSLTSNPTVTVNATVAALTTANGIADGSGARVAILELPNIDYSFVNDKIILSLDCSSHPCMPASRLPSSGLLHADQVAHFIGTTGHAEHNGISPGAEIISLASGNSIAGMYYALDWAVSNDVDVVNMSIGPHTHCSSSTARHSVNVISNDVVLSGTTLASAAGNQGPGYKTLTMPCSYNIINVGGIDDSGNDIAMYSDASRGPYHILDNSTRIATVMKPEIVAPAANVPIAVTASRTAVGSGTSFSAPQVSAAVAVLAGENDYLSPEDVRATLFLGANWTGPVPCTSVQFEQNNATDDCSYARKPQDASATSISILNNVGFGILNVGQSLHYTLQGNGQHVVAGDLLHDDVLEYQFNITNTARPVKVILTWLNNAFNAVSVPGETPTVFTSGRIYNLDLEVICPGMDAIHANSTHQNNEFAVFMPNQIGTCTAQVNSSDSQPYDSRKRFALASTILFNVESTSPRINVTSPVNATVITLTVDFGNAIKPDVFTASDVTTSTGTVSEPTTSDNQTFGFNITNPANEDIEISIAAGTVEYVSGNINAEAHARIERVPPTVVLSTITPSPTNAQGATFTATFSEPVAFDSGISDISVTGGAASNLSPSGTASTFTFTVTPAGDGEVTVQIPADAASDVAGKGNVASAVSRLTFDRTAPTVTLLTGEQSPTNAQDATFTATFSEPVTLGDGISGIDVTGGAASNLSPSGTASTFTFTVTPAGDGEVTVQIPADAASDVAGNENPASAVYRLTFDRTAPTVTLLTGEQSPTNAQDATFTATFSEPVAFDSGISDISVTGGAASNLSPSGTASTFTFTVTPAGDGEVTVQIPADAASDVAGNENPASAVYRLTFDRTAPTVTLLTGEQSPTNAQDATFTATFSEPVTLGDGISGIDVTGGAASNLSPSGTASTFTFTVTPAGDGEVTVQIPADAASDVAGNENPASAVYRLTFDRTAPTVTLLTGEQSPTNAQGATFTATFSEPVAFDSGISDISVTGGAASNLSPSGTASTFTFTVTPAGDGEVTVQIPADAASDVAGKGNVASAVSRLTFDRTAPTVTLLTGEQSPTNAQDATFTATFSEPVTLGDGISGIDVTGGAASNLSPSGTASTFTFTVTPTGDGEVTVRISSGAASDNAGNYNTASDAFKLAFDRTAPTVSSIERYSPSTATTDSQTLVYRITFSEDVTEVDEADFALSSDSTGGTSTSSGQFTQTRSPSLAIPDLQTVSDAITVADSGTATSVTVAVDITHTYIGDLKIDLVAPDGTTKTLHSRSGGSIDDINQEYTPDFDGVPIAGTWTLRISDNASSDSGTLNDWTLTINHGSTTTASPVTSISGSDDTYYAEVSATQDGTYNLDLVQSNDIKDIADNPLANTTPTGVDETYTVSTTITDTTAPTISSIERYSPSSATTDSQTLTYKVTFSEDVAGVGTTDFALSSDSTGETNGNNPVTSISGSGSVYYAEVSATQDGTYNLDLVQSNDIKDIADNPLANTTPTGADETYTVSTTITDTTAPTISSIERYSPSSATTDSQTLTYKDYLQRGRDRGGHGRLCAVLGQYRGRLTETMGTSTRFQAPAASPYAARPRDGTYQLRVWFSQGTASPALASNPLANTSDTITGADETTPAPPIT